MRLNEGKRMLELTEEEVASDRRLEKSYPLQGEYLANPEELEQIGQRIASTYLRWSDLRKRPAYFLLDVSGTRFLVVFICTFGVNPQFCGVRVLDQGELAPASAFRKSLAQAIREVLPSHWPSAME